MDNDEVFAPDDMRVVVWQFNINERDRVDGRPLHFPDVKRRWFYFDETTATLGSADHVSAAKFVDRRTMTPAPLVHHCPDPAKPLPGK